jgi:peptide/nickel transport system substrate-binding protein
MKHLSRYVVAGVAIALLIALIVPVYAQDVTPGKGGIIIEGNFGGDVASMNPIIASDTSSTRITGFLFPALIGVDPATGLFRKNDPTALAKDWTVSDDGKTYTFTLRDNWKWTDGTPITSADVLYSWNAAVAGGQNTVNTPLTFLLDIIDNVKTPDDHTVVVTFKNADCTALNNAGALPVVPSHVLPTDLTKLNDDPSNLNPTVTAGVFNFSQFVPGERTSLVANEQYPGATNGVVLPEGYVYKNVADQTVLTQQFLAGETNVIDSPPVNSRADLRADANTNVYAYPGDAWDYLALNQADPSNPQNGQDANGKPIDQGHHPLFGDPRVRQAIALAINVDDIIKGAVFGEGERMTSVTIPSSWAYDKDLPPIAYDPAQAAKLLDQAGWIADPNDPTAPRVAKGAMYAKDGTKASFVLYTNQGNSRRDAIATIVQDELKQVGIAVDYQAIDFNTLLDIMNGQTYDAIILGWRNGYPDDPDLTQLFSTGSDVVGSGNNFTSYDNADVDKLIVQARTLPGCDPAGRAKIYAQLQEQLQKDLPYVPLFAQNGMYAARKSVNGFSPYPDQLYWNVDTWSVAAP